MLDKFRSIAVGASLIVVILGLGLFLMVQMGGGEKIFGGGEGTLPLTDFETLVYVPTDAGYLLCPASLCKNAEADGDGALFNVHMLTLRQAVADFADSMPTVKTYRFDLANNQFEFTERLPGESLPAVVTVRTIATSALTSALVIYSHQPVGNSLSADHQARVERWVDQIRTRIEG